MKKILFLSLILILLAACRGDNEDDTPPPVTSIPTPDFLLRTDSLATEAGGWTMVEGTLNLEEREAALILSADYTKPEGSAVAKMNLSLYRDVAEAQQVFNDRVASLQTDSNVKLNPISAMADAAYTINETQGGIALVDTNGILILQFEGEELTHTELDVLNLMQIGVNALRVRTEKSVGGLGSATLQPIEEATP